MIQANELMIGNWVLTEQGHYQLTGFDIYKSDENNLHGLQPIQLTEEILIKAGFDKKIGITYFNKSENNIYNQKYFIDKIEFNEFYFCIAGMGTISKITYLHQLQNLYFALTGEELNINL